MSIFTWLKSIFVRSSEMPGAHNSSESSEPLDFSLPSKQNMESVAPDRASDKIENFGRKAKDFVQETGKEISEQGTAVWNEVKEKLHDLDMETKEFRDKIKEKASEALEKMDDFVDQTIEKAKSIQEKEDQLDQNKDGIADKPVEFGPAMSEKQGGFFDKAEQWVKTHDPETSKKGSDENNTNKNEPNRPTLDLPNE